MVLQKVQAFFREYHSRFAIQIGYREVHLGWIDDTRSEHAPLFTRYEAKEALLEAKPGQVHVRDIEALREAFQEILPDEPRPHRCIVSIPEASALFSMIEVEGWPRRRSQQEMMIEWHLQQRLNTSLESYRITWQAFLQDGRKATIATLAAWKPFLDDIEHLLGEFHVLPGMILPESFHVDSFLLHAIPQPERGSEDEKKQLLFHWDGERLVMTLFVGNRPILKRSRALVLNGGESELTEYVLNEIRLLLRFIEDFHVEEYPHEIWLSGVSARVVREHMEAHIPVRWIGELFPDSTLLHHFSDPDEWMTCLAMLYGERT